MKNQKMVPFLPKALLSQRKKELSARLVRLIDRHIIITGTSINQYKLIVISKKKLIQIPNSKHFISKFC